MKTKSNTSFDISHLLSELPKMVKDKHLDKNSKPEICYEQILAFEDVMTAYSVFVNPHDNRPCDMFSYGTIMKFDNLDIVFNIVKDYFNQKEFEYIIGYFLGQWYLSPISGLLAAALARKLSLPSPLEEKNKSYYNKERS